jgi:hypothetical protein
VRASPRSLPTRRSCSPGGMLSGDRGRRRYVVAVAAVLVVGVDEQGPAPPGRLQDGLDEKLPGFVIAVVLRIGREAALTRARMGFKPMSACASDSKRCSARSLCTDLAGRVQNFV